MRDAAAAALQAKCPAHGLHPSTAGDLHNTKAELIRGVHLAADRHSEGVLDQTSPMIDRVLRNLELLEGGPVVKLLRATTEWHRKVKRLNELLREA